ncbi:hypothetical protein WICANDRAFT_85347 [Wickerhamomyces anomalus NRRL Y-366-8]|uniref:Uncharacterized protein n=1 Tax=Wickerhamomyces anomalus (strain ATCC 58044 / CBS 1984 / NCYC 433 / NRRL Y-366-8) TaxID=683960 RepID=A0A1E3P083_WICAA|nr:uncharacterized protein WICANDRAFT_85347 [Wickerhamomyces anomalus NRRL Y-366-8]ODQ58277.1 hypothetical protein WICANDRAFT_85347 [Wickerhamomyces anomalus NRRL Y-366-8]
MPKLSTTFCSGATLLPKEAITGMFHARCWHWSPWQSTYRQTLKTDEQVSLSQALAKYKY